MGQAEVNLAKELKKPILPLLFEPIDGPPKQLGLIFTNKLHLKMYETPGKTVEDKLQELLQKLREHVGHWNQRSFVHLFSLVWSGSWTLGKPS